MQVTPHTQPPIPPMDVVAPAAGPADWRELPIARLEWTNVRGGHAPVAHAGFAVGPIIPTGGRDLTAAIEQATALSRTGHLPVAVGVLQAADGVLWLAKLGTKLHGVDANAYYLPGDDRLVVSAASPAVEGLRAIVGGVGLAATLPDAIAGSRTRDARVVIAHQPALRA